jgi:hypothetical protein
VDTVKVSQNQEPNIHFDNLSAGPFPVGWLAGQDFTITIRVPLEYQDANGKWVSFFPNETHDKEFHGKTLDSRETDIANNAVSGGWMGPWQSIP